jgi:hypothetical protein
MKNNVDILFSATLGMLVGLAISSIIVVEVIAK